MKEKYTIQFCILTSIFVSILLISNIASTKIISIFNLSIDGGTLLFPISYIFGDIFAEVYGRKKSILVILIGFTTLLFSSTVLYIVDILPSPADYTLSNSFHEILGQSPRIVISSLIAYLLGSTSNTIVLTAIKRLTKEKYLWIRTISSTLVGELIDSFLFVYIAFYGTLPDELLFTIFISNYILKTSIEIIFTPLTYLAVNRIKNT